jgi:hypothetical protein
MGLFKKARTGLGCTIQIIGGILWAGAGLVVFIWTLYVLFSLFGVWTIFVGLILAPVTYVASILIVWFSTGIFPLVMLIPYVVSWVGMGVMYVGSIISGED